MPEKKSKDTVLYLTNINWYLKIITLFQYWTDSKTAPLFSNLVTLLLRLQMVGDGIGGVWLIYNRVWEGDRGWILSCSFYFCFVFCFFICAFVLCSLVSPVPFLSDYIMIAVVSVSLFFYFFSLFLVPLTRSYWCIEIVVSVMQNYLKSEYLIIILWISL